MRTVVFGGRERVQDVKKLVRLFAKGAKITPGLTPAIEEARRAEREWRLEDALVLWAAVRRQFPDRLAGHLGHAVVLGKLNRCAEAIAALTATMERFPDEPAPAVDRARITLEFSAFEDALQRSRDLVAAFPDNPHGPELLGRALRTLLRFEEADAVLLAAQPRFPRHMGLHLEYVASADMRGDYPEGLRRSEALLRAFPNTATAHASVGAALKRLKRFDEADAVLRAALQRFPDNSNLYVNYAWVADDKGDWREALARWSAAHERFGQEPRIRNGFLESKGRADLARIDEVTDPEATAQPTAAAAEPAVGGGLPALFTRFEGLGENCEFGFAQRHFGAEPLGLLRWAGISFDKLLAGLDSSFEGVGGAERTRMYVNPNNQEYVITDTFYGFGMHTFLLRDEASEAITYKKMGRRLHYLRDKLVDDLAAGEKIFVFQTAQPLADDELMQLHAAIRRHGPGRLLAVRLAGEGGRRPGEVVPLAEGLAAGFIDRVGYVNNHWDVSFACWETLCRDTLALFEPDTPQG